VSQAGRQQNLRKARRREPGLQQRHSGYINYSTSVGTFSPSSFELEAKLRSAANSSIEAGLKSGLGRLR
jgi:hypothetical protein